MLPGLCQPCQPHLFKKPSFPPLLELPLSHLYCVFHHSVSVDLASSQHRGVFTTVIELWREARLPSPFRRTHRIPDRRSPRRVLPNPSGPSRLAPWGQGAPTRSVLHPSSFVPGLSEKPTPQTYRELRRALDMTKAHPGEFSVCFAELQQRFFHNHPRKLKDLILLVKYWYQQVIFKFCF